MHIVNKWMHAKYALSCNSNDQSCQPVKVKLHPLTHESTSCFPLRIPRHTHIMFAIPCHQHPPTIPQFTAFCQACHEHQETADGSCSALVNAGERWSRDVERHQVLWASHCPQSCERSKMVQDCMPCCMPHAGYVG